MEITTLQCNPMALVLTGMNFDKKDNLYEQAKTSLKKFLGECNGKVKLQ